MAIVVEVLLAVGAAVVVPLVVPPMLRWLAKGLVRCADKLCPEHRPTDRSKTRNRRG